MAEDESKASDIKKTELPETKIIQACKKFDSDTKRVIEALKVSCEFYEKTVNDKCDLLEQKISELVGIKDEIDNILVQYNQDVKKTAEDQYVLFKNDCNVALQDFNKRAEKFQVKAVEFLKVCSKRNLELINKIPVQKRKFEVKDALLIGFCVVNIITLVFR